MATLKSISSSQVFLATSILIILVSSANGDSPFCGTTEAGAERALCMNLVKGAKTWDQALTNVVHSIMDEANKAKPLFDGLPNHLPATLKPVTKDSMVKTCKEAYDNVFDNLNQVLGNIKNGDPMGSIDTELSATLSSLSDCTDGLNEFGVDDPALNKARDAVQKYASISLAISGTKKH